MTRPALYEMGSAYDIIRSIAFDNMMNIVHYLVFAAATVASQILAFGIGLGLVLSCESTVSDGVCNFVNYSPIVEPLIVLSLVAPVIVFTGIVFLISKQWLKGLLFFALVALFDIIGFIYFSILK